MKKTLIHQILCACAFFFIVVHTAYAETINYNEVIWQEDPTLDPLSLSAHIEFLQTGAYDFRMVIQNTSSPSTPSDYPATVMLTGIGFNLGGNSITGGIVYPDNLYPTGLSEDPSGYWGYTMDPQHGYFKQGEVTTRSVDTVVSTMTAATETLFLNNTNNGNPIAGPNWGVLSYAYPGTNAYPYFQDQIIIDIDLAQAIGNWDDFITDVRSHDVVVAFGSPTAPVPEPATMMLFGIGLVGLAVIGRKTVLNRM